MKIQYLGVIFVIIMLPIFLVFSAYIDAQIETLDLQRSYDTKLDNATYDAIKAFQLNTVNSSTSDLTNSKIRDIEAAANSFFTSIASAFNMVGYNSDNLKEYVPALVFTLYDGFYIYSPFENTLDEETRNSLSANATYTNGEEVTGLKPYIYYSSRYKKGTIDVIITYSLDNYITIQGIDSNGNSINDAGYLIDDVTYNTSSGEVRYRGITIEPESQLTEYIGGKLFPYIKINGVKYYYDEEKGTDDEAGAWFTLMNGQRMYGQGPYQLGNNDMGYKYYKEAAEFKTRLQGYGVTSLTSANAVDQYGNQLSAIEDEDGNILYDFVNGNYQIFNFDGIEEPDSDFNQHRLSVIRYVVETNLSVALANYNFIKDVEGTALSYDFRMPKIAEEDWTRILNNVSLISFLQGLSIGGKIYNGYSVINNNKNEEVVTEDSIYIVENINDDNCDYHRVTHEGLMVNANARGIFNIDFERKSIVNSDTENTDYYYPHKQIGCYTCYVTQTDAVTNSNIYEYLDGHTDLAKVYYTALGRERYSMYKANRNPSELTAQYKQIKKIDKRILIFGIPDYRGNNLYELQRKLQEKYTTVDLITGERGNITPVIDNQVLNRTDYDLIICDAYVWGTGNIANQDNLNYNLITISNDSNVTENNLIGEHIYTSDERVDTVITQPGILQDMTISSAGEWDASSMYKIKFKDGVRVLATATYQGDSETYDAIGYTTVGGYKQIHSQLVLYTNYVEVLERLVEFALE